MRHAKATLRGRPPRGREIEIVPQAMERGGVLLELRQWSRRNCNADVLVDVPLDEAQVLLRTWQSAVDEAYRRAKVAHKAELAAIADGGLPL